MFSTLRANYDAASLPVLLLESVGLVAALAPLFAFGVFVELDSLAALLVEASESAEPVPFDSEVSAVAELRPRLSVT
jgi:hypothetical protein